MAAAGGHGKSSRCDPDAKPRRRRPAAWGSGQTCAARASRRGAGILEPEASAGRLGSIARELQKMEFARENEQFRVVLRGAIIVCLWTFCRQDQACVRSGLPQARRDPRAADQANHECLRLRCAAAKPIHSAYTRKAKAVQRKNTGHMRQVRPLDKRRILVYAVRNGVSPCRIRRQAPRRSQQTSP